MFFYLICFNYMCYGIYILYFVFYFVKELIIESYWLGGGEIYLIFVFKNIIIININFVNICIEGEIFIF